jgi:hypothetical protein
MEQVDASQQPPDCLLDLGEAAGQPVILCDITAQVP